MMIETIRRTIADLERQLDGAAPAAADEPVAIGRLYAAYAACVVERFGARDGRWLLLTRKTESHRG